MAKSTTAAAKPRQVTRNTDLSIDFSTSMSQDELTSERAQIRGFWPKKLGALLDGVRAGQGKHDTFYRMGEFANASGARTVIRDFERNPEKLPAAFDLEARVVVRDGKRVSELWASVPSDAEQPAE